MRTNGAYAEGEEWDDFLGPDLESTPSTALGNIDGFENDMVHIRQMESDRGRGGA